LFARLATFENRDTPRLDGLVRHLNTRDDAEREVPGALALYLLADRTEGRALGLSLFESREAIKAAEPTFERIGNEIVEEMHGRRLSIEVFEVALHDVVDGAAAARLTTFKGDLTAPSDELRETAYEMFSEVRAQEGWRGTIILADRPSNVGKAVTLWESAEALRASEVHAADLRHRSTEHVGEAILSVSRLEVPFSFDRAPRLELPRSL
jgi:heme-degrading monooxygenase HmoA